MGFAGTSWAVAKGAAGKIKPNTPSVTSARLVRHLSVRRDMALAAATQVFRSKMGSLRRVFFITSLCLSDAFETRGDVQYLLSVGARSRKGLPLRSLAKSELRFSAPFVSVLASVIPVSLLQQGTSI